MLVVEYAARSVQCPHGEAVAGGQRRVSGDPIPDRNAPWPETISLRVGYKWRTGKFLDDAGFAAIEFDNQSGLGHGDRDRLVLVASCRGQT